MQCHGDTVKINKLMKKICTCKNLLYLIFLCAVILICSEVFGRIYLEKVLEKSPQRKFRFNYYRVYEHFPGFKEGKDGKYWIVINKNGFRRTEDVSKIKPENTFRAFFLGGSAAHGTSSGPGFPLRHIYPDETVDAYLEKMLSKEHPGYNIEIINAAVTGYQVFQHTQYILTELLDYDPDLIIFFDGANDHYGNNPDFDYYLDFRYQFWKSRLQEPSISGLIDYMILGLSKYSALARGYFSWKSQRDAVNNNDKIDMFKTYKDKNQLIHEHKLCAKKQFLRAIDINLLLLKHYDIDAIVCLQPVVFLRNKDLLAQEEIDFMPEVDDRFEILYPVVKYEVESLTDKYNVSFIDMMPVFNSGLHKKEQLFIDFYHLSPEGSKLAAEAIFPKAERVFQKRFYSKR